ncbi:hypothetical protein K1719_011997 [Acacia pycnantha]|nr:hypothetical protein K1719_011997 [Acacia pycnantha]
MLLSAITTSLPSLYFCNHHLCSNSHTTNLLLLSTTTSRPHVLPRPRSLFLSNASASSSPPPTSDTFFLQTLDSNPNPNSDTLRHVAQTTRPNDDDDSEQTMVGSASALASAIRKSSTSPVEFIQRIEKDPKSGLVLPSPDFQRLCVEQFDLFRRIFPKALLSVYVRPAGSYVMDRLELRRVSLNPRDADGIVILVGHFNIPTGLRVAEAALLELQAEVIPESKAVIFPMVKHPFVVGFLVAELPLMDVGAFEQAHRDERDSCLSVEKTHSLPPVLDRKRRQVQSVQVKDNPIIMGSFTDEQISNAVNISRSLAVAYVMDQREMLLQQSTWQNNVRMSNLVEQIRGPLSSIQTLSKILSTQTKRSEVAHDIVEDILLQGERLRDVLGQLQDAVHLTKANILRYNGEAINKMNGSTNMLAESLKSQLLDNFPRDDAGSKMHKSNESHSLSAAAKDIEMPLPPFALAPLQHGIRPCNVSEVLIDLVDAARPLARNQNRLIELNELSSPLLAAVEGPAMRQAFSNLIEGALLRTHVGGKVEILCTDAPAGGTLVIIDDDGPDMQYMTQMHSLTSYGPELLSEDMVDDNMTWNFVAGLSVAREILESYGCVVRVVSPRIRDAPLGAGGTRVELWLPSSIANSDLSNHVQEL